MLGGRHRHTLKGIIQKVCSSCRGGGGSLKSKLKKQVDGGQSSLSVHLLCEKICPDFQTVGRVLSDKLLGSC